MAPMGLVPPAPVLVTTLQQINFLLTGVFSTITNQIIFNSGGAERSTLLLSVPTYLGMMAIVLFSEGRQELPVNVTVMSMVGTAGIDVLANIICMAGLQLVGSGMFQVLYASVVCFAAILTRTFLGKHLSLWQWVGIIIVAVGLGTTSLGGHHHQKQVMQEDEDFVHIFVGIGVTLAGCVGYAGSYVAGEYMLRTHPTLQPQRLCVQIGSTGSVLLAVYMSMHTFPKWDNLVSANIKKNNGNPQHIFLMYTGLMASSFLHNWAHFYLLRHSGAVSLGVLQSLRSVGVFVISGILFCDTQATQCMTTLKSIACMIVAAGVVAYSYGSQATVHTIELDPDLEEVVKVVSKAVLEAEMSSMQVLHKRTPSLNGLHGLASPVMTPSGGAAVSFWARIYGMLWRQGDDVEAISKKRDFADEDNSEPILSSSPGGKHGYAEGLLGGTDVAHRNTGVKSLVSPNSV